MKIKDLREKLKPLIDEDLQVIETKENHYIEITLFINRFEGSDLTLSSLLNNPNTEEVWEKRFRDWNKRGILPD